MLVTLLLGVQADVGEAAQRGDSLELIGCQAGSRLSDRSYLKATKQRMTKQDTQLSSLTSMYAYRHTYEHRQCSPPFGC